jgi:hypothetical protein
MANHDKSQIEDQIKEAERQLFSNEFHAEDILNSKEYEFMQRMLVDQMLVDEPMYVKLRARIEAFYVNTERVKKLGMTESQQATITQSGFPMSYRI